VAAFLGVVIVTMPIAAGADTNYDESAVVPYTLPNALAGPDGKPAATSEDWTARCRRHQFALLEKNVYGRRLPPAQLMVAGEPERADVTLAGGVRATRLQVRLRLGDGPKAATVDLLVYLPKAERPVPVFLNLNFKGNQAEHPDPEIWLTRAWLPNDEQNGIVGNRATEASRTANARRWPVEAMLARGYGMATACYGDIFPDKPDGRAESVLASLGRPMDGELAPDEPGAIAAWAWGLSRILDWLVRQPEIDATRVIVVGHSRNGKAALWAGACDERFAMVVSNESGCGGAALERRNYGETIADITTRFPHWFCPAFATYAGREAEMPTDQHVLLAMAAPRPLYVASAIDDRWADPRGEFLAAVAAEPVWKLFGLEGLGTAEWPPVDAPVGSGRIGYHVRTGAHDLLEYDWQRFADFADRNLPAVQPPDPSLAAGAFRPAQDTLPVPPPPGAIVLFGDGSALPAFTAMNGGPIDWKVENGTLVVNTTNGPRQSHRVERTVSGCRHPRRVRGRSCSPRQQRPLSPRPLRDADLRFVRRRAADGAGRGCALSLRPAARERGPAARRVAGVRHPVHRTPARCLRPDHEGRQCHGVAQRKTRAGRAYGYRAAVAVCPISPRRHGLSARRREAVAGHRPRPALPPRSRQPHAVSQRLGPALVGQALACRKRVAALVGQALACRKRTLVIMTG
jgi:hypothetical protein